MELIKASLMAAAGGGKSANLQHNPTLTTNGTHRPDTGYDGFDYVTVDVPIQPQPVITETGFTENGRYEATDYGVDAWSVVTVNVQYVADDPQGLTYTFDVPVTDVDTKYYIKSECVPESQGSTRLKYVARLYDDHDNLVEEYRSVSFPSADRAQWKWMGIEVDPTTGTWTTLVRHTDGSQISYIRTTDTSPYLRDHYTGQHGYGVQN